MHRVAILALSVLIAHPLLACTTFCVARNGEVLFGRNYDFEIGQGYVMTNARGVAKTSMAGTLRWTSRYGSVTFNQWGREFPMDGMNEQGLVIALMWLDGTVYPRNERPALRVLEWIQYNLDNYATVDELLAKIDRTRIGGGAPLHYLIGDAKGDAATIEYLGGRLVVHRGRVLANDTYERSKAYLDRLHTEPGGNGSLDRFARASMMLGERPLSTDRAFEVLAAVAQPGWTRWSVVYDAKRREISWVSDRNAQRRIIRMSALKLACGGEAKMLDAHAPLAGDVTAKLEKWSAERNRELVRRAYATTSFTKNEPARAADEEAAHAEACACAR
ncbi:MAG TPA: linear amide C-N hydrolase [Thermoanaerobaculia bacterium]|nr:linear amide C-N hydrolase [Thermoanaerobaculia bacterium]